MIYREVSYWFELFQRSDRNYNLKACLHYLEVGIPNLTKH